MWNGQEIIDAIKALEEAKSLAFKDVQNHFTRRKMITMYISICESRLEIIERVLPKVTTLPVIVQEAEIVADFYKT